MYSDTTLPPRRTGCCKGGTKPSRNRRKLYQGNKTLSELYWQPQQIQIWKKIGAASYRRTYFFFTERSPDFVKPCRQPGLVGRLLT